MKNELDKHIIAYNGNTIYNFDNEILLNWYSQRIIEQTEKESVILELGLGHGITTKIFSNYYKKNYVLEGSEIVIKNYKKGNPECKSKIIKTYFENYNTEKKFDIIIMGFILEHVDNPLEILKHFKHFLKENGKIFVSVPNAESMNRRLGNLAGLLPDMHKLSLNDLNLGHKRFFTVNSLKQLMTDAGYKIKNIEGIYLKPLTTNQLVSLNLEKNILESLCLLGKEYPELSCGILCEGFVN